MEDDDLLIDDGEDMAEEEGEEEDLLADVASTAAQAWNWGEPEVPSTPARDAGGSATLPVMASPLPAAKPAAPKPVIPVAPARATTSPAPPPPRPNPPTAPHTPAPAAGFRTPPASQSGPTFSQELDAFLKTPKQGAVEDLDLADMLDAPSQLTPALPPAMPAVAPDAGRGVRVLVVDPESVRVDSAVEKALERMGFAPTLVETGTAARDELTQGQHPVAFLRITGDPSWARMLLLTSQERFPDIKFVVMVPKGSSGLTQQLIECGAADVMEEPLPPDANLLFHIQALVPELLPNAAHSQHMLNDMEQLRSRLTAAVAESEARAREMAQRAAEAEQRLQSVSHENTRRGRELSTVRGEAGNLRERAEALQDTVKRMELEVQALRTRNTELEATARAAPAVSAGGDNPDAALLAEIKKLVAALHPYGFAMDQAVTFLTDMGKLPSADPGLARHVKNLQLCRAVIKRLESKVGA